MIAQVVCPRMKHWQPDFLHPFSTPGFRAEEANEGLFPLIHKHGFGTNLLHKGLVSGR